MLKTFLDLVPQKGLAGKVVLPLFIGGSLAHLLSIDYSLKPVLSALGARHILGGVYTVDSQVARTEQGGFEIVDELITRLEDNINELVEETHRRLQYSASK
ncbi:FMN reductase (NADPH) [compost metagenome]